MTIQAVNSTISDVSGTATVVSGAGVVLADQSNWLAVYQTEISLFFMASTFFVFLASKLFEAWLKWREHKG